MIAENENMDTRERHPSHPVPPTSHELIVCFVAMVGLERLEPVLSMLEPEEVFEIRKAAMATVSPRRMEVARAVLSRKVTERRRSTEPVRPDVESLMRTWLA